MTNLTERSIAISEMLYAFKKDVEPVKERFYKFLDEYQPQGSGFPDYDLVGYGIAPSPSEFVLDVWQMGHGKGLTFDTVVRDHGDSTTLWFTIPDAYLADPDAFEEEFLQKKNSEQLKAKKIVAGIFGEAVLEDVSFNAYSMNPIDDDFLIIDIAPNPWKRPGLTDGHKYFLSMLRSYAWHARTGKFYYGGRNVPFEVAQGRESEALGEVFL